MKILVVDDSFSAREPMELHLQASGHQVTGVDDGETALNVLEHESFDLIVTDIRMPKINGLELLARVKSADPDQDVIIITGYGDMRSSLEALRHGAANYLMKPVSLDELSMAVQAVAERQALSRKVAEQDERLRQARKMADLGIVAAGVAHEINNPNTFMRGNIQTLKKYWGMIEEYFEKARAADVEPPPKLDYVLNEIPGMLEAMLEGSDRIQQIVSNASTIIRSQANGRLFPVDLNMCVREAIEVTAAEFGEVDVRFNPDPDLPPVRALDAEMVEIVRELLKNAVAAAKGIQQAVVELTTRAVGPGEVSLTVRDNGAGIPEEIRARIFTPFFSGDSRIGRPGLGLSKVYTLVKRFGGETDFDGPENGGTCFRVKLPVYVERT
jgi:two-component system NtrC family sensor kinase